MASPLATEKVLRGILRSLVKGNLLSTVSDAEAIEAIPNNASEADILTIINGLSYGAVSITGVSTPDLLSNGELTAWTDVDYSFGNHLDYFRVATRGVDATVHVDKHTEIATIGRSFVAALGQTSTQCGMNLGPRTLLLDASDTTGYSGVLNIGAYHLAATNYNFATLVGGPAALMVDNGFGTGGFSITTKKNVEIRASSHVSFVDSASNTIRSGAYSLGTADSGLFVGEYPATANADALLISRVIGSDSFEIKSNSNQASRVLYINSNCSTSYSLAVGIGAIPTDADREPGSHAYPQLSVYGTTIGNDTVALFKATQAGAGGGPYSGNIVRIIHNQIGSNLFNFIWCGNYTGPGVDNYTGVFRVNGGGAVWGASFTSPFADLAEWMPTDAPHDPGSVLIMRNGIAVLSDAYEATGVVGVVSSQPGLVMNGMCEGKENHVRVAKSGMVPVFFSTEFGDVEGNGELLCAGPGGYAVRAPEIPKPGSIVGKAMSAMSSYHGDDVCGVIQMLVC
jgi:hypothetical protein